MIVSRAAFSDPAKSPLSGANVGFVDSRST